jgi:hypothetical protein
MNALMPSMGTQGMSGIGAPPIQSPAQIPQGMPKEDMDQIMALARKMSDMQLADVLSGKNMDVPQSAALMEAMGRRSLRNAVKGAQAQGQLQKPNLKQQLLADLQAEGAPPLTPQMNPALQPQQSMMAAEGGLASLPAPNMESMDMAAGGIVAFADPSNDQEVKDEEVRDPNKPLTKEEMQSLLQGRGLPTNKKTPFQLPENIGTSQRMRPYTQERKAQKAATALTPEALDAKARGEGVFPEGSPALPGSNLAVAPPTTPPPPPAGLAAAASRPAMPPAQPAPAAPPPPPTGGLSAQDYDTRRKASMEEAMSYFKDEIAGNKKAEAGLDKIRTQGSGEALMMIAAAISGTPNMTMAMAKGLPLVAAQSASVRKELDTLQGKIDDRSLALKKATKAYEQGDMKSYTDYMDTVSQADYRIKSASNQLISANASKLSAEASMVRATSDKTATQAANKMDIAIGNKVMDDIKERRKNDYAYKTKYDKMSLQQQEQEYLNAFNIAKKIYGDKTTAGTATAPVDNNQGWSIVK